jgi:CHASE3 domain sensor protein
MWDFLIFLGCAVAILLLLAVLLELRRIRQSIQDLHSSNRETSRSLIAAVHDVSASLLRTRKSDSISSYSDSEPR